MHQLLHCACISILWLIDCALLCYVHNGIYGLLQPLEAKNLIKLNFHKNAKGEYHCPVLYKAFTKHSHIVAVGTTGNVFSYEVIH
jgi:peptidyl-prolyl cis-trans isomerase-like protein 2